mmetsp:Transcript_6928/g.11035  ORF Transcript_6928/g.11035 Transcript_6928/m.11035 type:complete len:421 (+) Transcript_6928:1944-3206(+)
MHPRQVQVARRHRQPQLLRFLSGRRVWIEIAIKQPCEKPRPVMRATAIAIGKVEHRRRQMTLMGSEPPGLFHQHMESQIERRQKIDPCGVLNQLRRQSRADDRAVCAMVVHRMARRHTHHVGPVRGLQRHGREYLIVIVDLTGQCIKQVLIQEVLLRTSLQIPINLRFFEDAAHAGARSFRCDIGIQDRGIGHARLIGASAEQVVGDPQTVIDHGHNDGIITDKDRTGVGPISVKIQRIASDDSTQMQGQHAKVVGRAPIAIVPVEHVDKPLARKDHDGLSVRCGGQVTLIISHRHQKALLFGGGVLMIGQIGFGLVNEILNAAFNLKQDGPPLVGLTGGVGMGIARQSKIRLLADDIVLATFLIVDGVQHLLAPTLPSTVSHRAIRPLPRSTASSGWQRGHLCAGLGGVRTCPIDSHRF